MARDQQAGLTLVYRVLRRISKWTLAFYSEVYITGQENVPSDGPVLLYVLTLMLCAGIPASDTRVCEASHVTTTTVLTSPPCVCIPRTLPI